MTPSNLSMYVVFMVLSCGINDVIPPIAKGIYMVELIGVLITRISILAMHVL